jgi:hypothetical protein
MASGASYRGGRFIEAGQGFLGVLLGSQVLRWMVPEMVLRDIASRRWLYLAAKPSLVGVDMDGLACPLHHPTVCSCQTRGQSFLSGAALSRHAAMGGGAFLGDAKPPGLDI